jgi:hypothetical protein
MTWSRYSGSSEGGSGVANGLVVPVALNPSRGPATAPISQFPASIARSSKCVSSSSSQLRSSSLRR